jgi:hypothetical protein
MPNFNLVDILLAMMSPDLPDMTPVLVDANIKEFVSKLCCTVNPVAVIYKKQVCQRCFELLRASYIYPEWDLGGGSD